jgi:hypothetical protein
MSQHDAVLYRELKGRVERLEAVVEALQVDKELRAEISVLRMRLGSLQGQINTLRALHGRTPIEPPPDAPVNPEGEDDAARQ